MAFGVKKPNAKSSASSNPKYTGLEGTDQKWWDIRSHFKYFYKEIFVHLLPHYKAFAVKLKMISFCILFSPVSSS